MKTKILLSITFICFTCLIKAQTTKNYDVNSFTAVAISNGLDVYITQGNSHSVKAEGNDKRLEKLKVENTKNGLKLKYTGKTMNNETIKVYVTMTNLENLAVAGGSDVFLNGKFKTEKLSIAVSGGSDLDVQNIDATKINLALNGGSDAVFQKMVTNELKLAVSDGSDIDIVGRCHEMNLAVTGGSDVESNQFIVENAIVTVSGGSDATIHVTKTISLVASGASDITCTGNPSNVSQTVTRDSDVEIL